MIEESRLPEENTMDESYQDSEMLMKQAKRKIGLFIVFMILTLVFIIIGQSEPLFVFQLNPTFSDTDSVHQFFSMVSFLFMSATFIYMIAFVVIYHKRKKQTAFQQLESLESFKKQYSWFDLFSVVPVFLLVLSIVNGFFFGFATVVGPSMEPTFCENDTIIINHFNASYELNDVVIIDAGDQLLIKRIVAMPGDFVSVSTEGTKVNGELISSYYSFGFEMLESIVPEGKVFVVGDHYTNSNDSRYFGFVSLEDILGEEVLHIKQSSCPVE